MSAKKPPQVAFCPEHGSLTGVDEDGLCPGCGASCMGDAIDEFVAWALRARGALKGMLDRYKADGGEPLLPEPRQALAVLADFEKLGIGDAK